VADEEYPLEQSLPSPELIGIPRGIAFLSKPIQPRTDRLYLFIGRRFL
jgi:hypothetical protein